ncbi:hypothetical protein CAEBREN_17925 [Caenorhabditis brenneri]|uniref:Uncharacterized protein n=1 Tax=Caenorhabditis brenneri TaxID=135651 RepID=G0NYB3_CAEBE|nr:hypothetical protein CAEBREN_17925 [Caenorhabditis brenneri]
MSGHGVIVELSNEQSSPTSPSKLREYSRTATTIWDNSARLEIGRSVSDFTEQSLRVFPNCNNYLGHFERRNGFIVELSNDQSRGVSDSTERTPRVFSNCNYHLGQFRKTGDSLNMSGHEVIVEHSNDQSQEVSDFTQQTLRVFLKL